MADWPSKSFKLIVKNRFAGEWGAEEGGSEVNLPCIRVADFNRFKNIVSDDVPTIRSISKKTAEVKQLQHQDILIEKSGGGDKTPVGTPILYLGSENAICSNFIEVVRLQTGHDPKFWTYVLISSYESGNTRRFINQTTGIQNIDSQRFYDQVFCVPPLRVQQRIADYLDRETAEIDAAVADLDKYVELLEKRRRRVVIRGFSDPKYNPVLQRLKFLTVSEDHRRIPIKSGDRVDVAGEFPYYGASGVIDYVNDYLWDNEKRLLLSEDGANLVMRNHPVAFVADGQYWVNNHAHVLKCRGETPPELVAKAIEVTSIAHLITGSAQPKLTAAAMGEIEFLFPLSVPDQKALLADLQPEMEEIDALIEESTKLRNLLLKRRSVLITEVVTGRKQV